MLLFATPSHGSLEIPHEENKNNNNIKLKKIIFFIKNKFMQKYTI